MLSSADKAETCFCTEAGDNPWVHLDVVSLHRLCVTLYYIKQCPLFLTEITFLGLNGLKGRVTPDKDVAFVITFIGSVRDT